VTSPEPLAVCDHCGTKLRGEHEGIPWEAEEDASGGYPAHSVNRCRHILRDQLRAIRLTGARVQATAYNWCACETPKRLDARATMCGICDKTIPLKLSRDELVSLAQDLATGRQRVNVESLSGLRVVVLVCDQTGDFVGVGMTTHLEDALAMMRCALAREDAQTIRPVDPPEPIGGGVIRVAEIPDGTGASEYTIDGATIGLRLPPGLLATARMVADQMRRGVPPPATVTPLADHPTEANRREVAEDAYAWVCRCRHAPGDRLDDDDFAVAFGSLCMSLGLSCELVTWRSGTLRSGDHWRMGVKVGEDVYAFEGKIHPWPQPRWMTDPKTGMTRSPLVKP